MLNIDEIQNGIVIDHIKAGTAVGLMDLLGIKSNRTASVALIQNARSSKSPTGRKDIIKVEGDAAWLNLDVLAYLDPNITVTTIQDGKAVKKEKPQPPRRLVNIVRCRNPRCISTVEEENATRSLSWARAASTAASTASRSCRSSGTKPGPNTQKPRRPKGQRGLSLCQTRTNSAGRRPSTASSSAKPTEAVTLCRRSFPASSSWRWSGGGRRPPPG